MGDWTFFSNYGHVLVCLSRDREVRLRDVAAEVGITERAVQKIVRDLQDAGFLNVTKQGRCNRYRINRRKSLRHSLESQCTVGKLLALVGKGARSGATDDDEAASAALTPFAAAGDSPKVSHDTVPAAPPAAAKAEAEPEAADTTERAEKKERKKTPSADTRQQGSLF